VDIFWRGIIHLYFGQTILDKTNPPSLADCDYKRPGNKYSPTRDCTLNAYLIRDEDEGKKNEI
tara:strand:+ start:139 stop:327 length:189 start_codon:yes stop_codon:yes gene_type:complete